MPGGGAWLVQAFLLTLLLASTGAADTQLTIDNFEEGSLFVADSAESPGGAWHEQSDLESVAGGVRSVYVATHGSLLANAAATTATLATADVTDDGVLLAPTNVGWSYICYDGKPDGRAAIGSGGNEGELHMDLRGSDAVVVQMSAIDATRMYLYLELWNSEHRYLSGPGLTAPLPTTVFPLPHGDAGFDLGDVRQLCLRLLEFDGSFRVDSIAAVSDAVPPPTGDLPAPQPLAPTSGGFAAASAPEFTWTPVPGATGYRIAVATSHYELSDDPGAPACGRCSLDATTTASAHVHADGLPESTVHWWRVQALPSGTWSEVAVFTTSGAVPLLITSPEPGTEIDATETIVRGLVEPLPGTEVGIEVNGIVSFTAPGEFGAAVPVDPSVEVLTATARDASGDVLARHAVPVSVTIPAEAPVVIGFSVAPDMGSAPHTAHFGFSTRKFVLTLTLDADNDGVPERAGRGAMDADTEPSYTYEIPDLYEPTLTVVTDSDTLDSLPETHTLSELVRVYSTEELDAILKPKWSAMKDVLRAGNVSAALEHIVIRRRSDYADVFNDLTIPLGDIDQELTDITFSGQLGRSVEYEMHRTENGTLYSYPVVFRIDEDGIWRLEAF